MAAITESSDTRSRRPLTTAAPLLGVLGAAPGGFFVGGVASFYSGSQWLLMFVYFLGGIAVAVVGCILGARIDRRGYPKQCGWRAVLVCLGMFTALGTCSVVLLRPARPGFLLSALVFTFAPYVGALIGSRIGEMLDRRREITGQYVDVQEQPQ